MTVHYSDDRVTLHHGDCLDVLPTLPDNSVGAVCTDPPYNLSFMSKPWDAYGNAFQAWCQLWAAECLRILKPGSHLLAFGGTRTSHRLACAIEDAGFEIRDSIAWLYGSGFPKSLDVSKAIDKAAGAEREVVGIDLRYVGMSDKAKRAQGAVTHDYSAGWVGDPSQVTAPATPEAARWQGWGTALKPGWEIVVVAQKALSHTDYLDRIGSWLAQVVDPKTPIGAAVASDARTDTSQSESVTTMSLNTVSSWRNCWAEICEAMSTSTTETTSNTTTDLKTLCSCLAQITPENITQAPTGQDGWSSPVELADNLFAAVVLNLRVTRMLTATASATKPIPPTSQDAAGQLEPVIVARKPLQGTVSANVQRWGTGALNIDATRIGTDWATDPTRRGWQGRNLTSESGSVSFVDHNKELSQPHDAGRWPANVVLDESQAEALDQMSGEFAGVNGGMRQVGGKVTFSETILDKSGNNPKAFSRGNADFGGASRFFYTAKASTDERIRHDGVSHPTVKPLSLMRWLVRLVTPPGGLILDPFAGSGTTVEAALLEGFRCVAIEREAEYLPLVTQRINRRLDPIAYLAASGDDLGLFGDS